MDELIIRLRPVAGFLMRRTVFLLPGAGRGRTYRHQRAVEAIRQSRVDSIDAQLPR